MKTTTLRSLLSMVMITLLFGHQSIYASEQSTFLDGQEKFALQFTESILKERGQKNSFISPFSAQMAFYLLLAGAKNESHDFLMEKMGLEQVSPSLVHQYVKNLIDSLSSNEDSTFQFEVANSIWSDYTLPMNKDYIDLLGAFYDATAKSLNFKSPLAAPTINNWVKNKTHGKIDKITNEDLLAQQVLMLINATYFKGQWANPFNKYLTQSSEFFNHDKTVSSVDMMKQNSYFAHFANKELQAIKLPYKGTNVVMNVIVPQNQDLESFINDYKVLSPKFLKELDEQMKAEFGTLSLPKWKMEDKKSLISNMKDLGLGPLLTGSVDLSGISQHQLFVSSALQKTFLKVDENGTEAAAVTAIGMTRTSINMPKFHMVVNHPFIVIIKDDVTGTILFVGTINKL